MLYNYFESISFVLFDGLLKFKDFDLLYNRIDLFSKDVMKNIDTIERLKLGYN